MRSSPSKQRTRAVQQPARRSRPVQYKLTKSEADLARESVERRASRPSLDQPEEDYAPFLMAMFGTATFVFMVQAMASLIIANYLGSTISIKLWLYVLPYVELTVAPSAFVSVTTWGTVATVAAATLRALSSLAFKRGGTQALDGRAMGIVMGGLLLVYQYIRHLLNPPLIDTWVYAQTMAGVVAASVIYLGFRPTTSSTTSTSRSPKPARVGPPTNPSN